MNSDLKHRSSNDIMSTKITSLLLLSISLLTAVLHGLPNASIIVNSFQAHQSLPLQSAISFKKKKKNFSLFPSVSHHIFLPIAQSALLRPVTSISWILTLSYVSFYDVRENRVLFRSTLSFHACPLSCNAVRLVALASAVA